MSCNNVYIHSFLLYQPLNQVRWYAGFTNTLNVSSKTASKFSTTTMCGR